ncbi:MAG: sulfatase, partial [Candidatus Binatia bacterium]
MRRVASLLGAAVLAGLGLYRAICEPARNVANPKAPNVILVTIDTLRADRLGVYGSARKLTPNLDALAADGVLFEDAFCVMPVTIPAHASILFGTWPKILGSTSNHVRIAAGGSAAYLPKELWNAGYRTAAFLSADHLGNSLDRFAGFETLDFPWEDRTVDETLALARRWLDEHGDAPFFLWIHLWDPHAPYRLHPVFGEAVRRGLSDRFEARHGFVEPGVLDAEEVRTMIDLYDNEVAFLDHRLGEFLAFLRGTPLWQETLLAVTADHGETLDELLAAHGYAFDHGEYLHDSQIRVPLILRLPAGAHGGATVDGAVSHVDLMPTILDALGM